MKKICNFYGREFIVNQGVLTPRPETEQMVDMVLSLVGKPYLPGVKPGKAVLPEDLTILDVGTGSGCIAITLKLELPKSTIYAVDISNTAIQVAKRNAKLHKVDQKITVFHSDLMSNATFRPELAKKIVTGFQKHRIYNIGIPDRSKIDLVVANLPYVDENWEWIDKEALSKEPRVALYAKDGGLALIFKLINQVVEGGIKHLILEADPCQHKRICKYAKKRGLTLSETRGFILYLSE